MATSIQRALEGSLEPQSNLTLTKEEGRLVAAVLDVYSHLDRVTDGVAEIDLGFLELVNATAQPGVPITVQSELSQALVFIGTYNSGGLMEDQSEMFFDEYNGLMEKLHSIIMKRINA